MDDFGHNFINDDDGSGYHSDAADDVNQLMLTDEDIDNTNGYLGFGWSCSDPQNRKYTYGVSRNQKPVADHRVGADRYGSKNSDTENRIFTTMHEICHQLGGSHSHGNWEETYQGLSKVTTRTLMGSNPNANDFPGNCMTETSNSKDYDEFAFADCSLNCNF